MQVCFHDGSHLPFSPLMSLARLPNDSQHIALAAICLSAFTAKQTSEQPYSLMRTLLHVFLLRHTPSPSFHCSFPSSLPVSNPTNFCGFLRPILLLLYFIFIPLWPQQASSSPPPSPIPPISVPVGFAQRCVCLFLRGSE